MLMFSSYKECLHIRFTLANTMNETGPREQLMLIHNKQKKL